MNILACMPWHDRQVIMGPLTADAWYSVFYGRDDEQQNLPSGNVLRNLILGSKKTPIIVYSSQFSPTQNRDADRQSEAPEDNTSGAEGEIDELEYLEHELQCIKDRIKELRDE